MLSNREMAIEVMKRARALRTRRLLRKQVAVLGLAVAACLAVIVYAAVRLPGRVDMIARQDLNTATRGALFLHSEAIGFVVIGVFAFLLGVAVTLLAVTMKKRAQGDDKQAQ